MTNTESTAIRHESFQAEKFRELKVAIKEGIDDLKKTTAEGFNSLLNEFRLSREQGHIPLSVMEKMMNSNNEAYKDMMKSNNEAFKESRKSTDESYSKILRHVCWMMAAILAWVTGMKMFLPDIKFPEKTMITTPATPTEKPETGIK